GRSWPGGPGHGLRQPATRPASTQSVAFIPVEEVDDGPPHNLGGASEVVGHLRPGCAPLPDQAEHHVLGAYVVVPELYRPHGGKLEPLLCPGAEGPGPQRRTWQ